MVKVDQRIRIRLRGFDYRVLDQSVAEIVETVRAASRAVPGILEVEKCRVRKMGLEFYVDLHVGVDERISVRAGHDLAHEVKDAIRRAEPRIADVLVHIEPATPARSGEFADEDR